MKLTNLLYLGSLGLGCAQVPIVAHDAAAEVQCQAKRAELKSFVEQNNLCKSDLDCSALSIELSGQCGVFKSGDGAPFKALEDEVIAACRPIPQMAAHCPSQRSVCRAGRCAGQPVDQTECDASTLTLEDALKTADDSCTTATDCVAWQINNSFFGVRPESWAKIDGLKQNYFSACGRREMQPVAAKCEASRCSPQPLSSVMTRPKLSVECLQKALGPLATQYKGILAIRASIFDDNQMNYFSVEKGPPSLPPEALWRMSRCPVEAATLNGKPVSIQYVFHLLLR